MNETKMIRQGDVLVFRCDSAETKGAKRVKKDPRGVVLAEGEATGHHHRIQSPGVCMLFRKGTTDRVLTVARDIVQLVHEEHSAISISKGTYKVRRQVEWSLGKSRRVED